MYRQIIQLEGKVTNANLPALDVTQKEIDTAQLASIASWPALASWGVSSANTGVLDRLNDSVRLANGSALVSSRFVTGGVPILEGYSLNNVDQAIVSALDTSGSFTVGIVVRNGLATGSYSSSTGQWWVIHDNIDASPTKGKLRISIGGITSTYAEYNGPPITATDWHYIVIIVDRTAGTIKIRHNGADALLKAGLSPAASILNEFAVGIFNTGTQALRAAQYRSPIAFTKAVSGTDLATLEAMLAEKCLV